MTSDTVIWTVWIKCDFKAKCQRSFRSPIILRHKCSQLFSCGVGLLKCLLSLPKRIISLSLEEDHFPPSKQALTWVLRGFTDCQFWIVITIFGGECCLGPCLPYLKTQESEVKSMSACYKVKVMSYICIHEKKMAETTNAKLMMKKNETQVCPNYYS